MAWRVRTLYFSPTRTTKRVVEAVGDALADRLGSAARHYDITTPSSRTHMPAFEPHDVLVVGLPVYGGRIPPSLEETLRSLDGKGASVVVISVYGNRDYDDALLELADLMQESGFSVCAAAAFVGEHSFSRRLAEGRPDERDLVLASDFGQAIADKLLGRITAMVRQIKGNRPYRERGAPYHVTPKTADNCNGCLACALGCPAGSISRDDPRVVDDGCMRCFACVKRCPLGAKFFDDEPTLKATTWLEENFMERKEPALFL